MEHHQRKDTTHAQHQRPAAAAALDPHAHRVDGPKIDVWYKPEEHGALDGFLVWQDQEQDRLSVSPRRSPS